MRKFYICTTGIAKGPFNVSDLESLELKGNDLIWSKQYYDTRLAIEVPEFRDYFKRKQASGNKKLYTKMPAYQQISLALLLSALLGLVCYYCIAM